jgi:hypothetical protein
MEYGVPPAENGLKYDSAIDVAIMDKVSRTIFGSLGSAELKRKIQKNP